MLKFRPIHYGEDDFRAYKYSLGASSKQEGQFCYVANSDQHTSIATPHSGVFQIVAATLNDVSIIDKLTTMKKFFPIYRENPDNESITSTITAGTHVIGFHGSEYEVHKSCTERGALGSFAAVGGKVALGSTGKLTYVACKNATDYLVAEVVATLNATWLRVRKL